MRLVRDFLVGTAGMLLLLQVIFLVRVFGLRRVDPQSTRFMESRGRHRMAGTWVSYDAVSEDLKRAVIAAEDSKFARHKGFDWRALRFAALANWKRRKWVVGGSTITQQLARNLYLSGQPLLRRKAQEAAIAVMLETLLSKRRILELYLNVVEWGDGLFGIRAAADHYYERGPSELDLQQSAVLAAILPDPRTYDRHGDAAGFERRRQRIAARAPSVLLPPACP